MGIKESSYGSVSRGTGRKSLDLEVRTVWCTAHLIFPCSSSLICKTRQHQDNSHRLVRRLHEIL